MRWYYRRAKLGDPALRQTFEQHGVGTMQALMAAPDRPFVHNGQRIDANRVRDDLLLWLREHDDRDETWKTWSLVIVIAIMVLVLLEFVRQR